MVYALDHNAMGALALLTWLANNNYNIRLDGDTLYIGPAKQLSAELVDQIRQYKPAIVKLLNKCHDLIPISRLPPEGEAIIAAHEAQAEALTKTAAQWQQLSNKTTTASEHDYYNAMRRLRQAIDSGHKLDVDIWSYIVAQLPKEAIV